MSAEDDSSESQARTEFVARRLREVLSEFNDAAMDTTAAQRIQERVAKALVEIDAEWRKLRAPQVDRVLHDLSTNTVHVQLGTPPKTEDDDGN